MQIPAMFKNRAIIPQILPALVMSLPDGSIVPALISLRSLLPMTQAIGPRMIPHTKMLTIPKTRIRVPRCGFMTKDSPSKKGFPSASIQNSDQRVVELSEFCSIREVADALVNHPGHLLAGK